MNWNLVEHSKRLMTNFGAAWVMWVLLALSVVSVAIMLERGWFYYSLRDDLAGLNLARVPAVFIECANMRNPREAVMVSSAAGRERYAAAISAGILAFLAP